MISITQVASMLPQLMLEYSFQFLHQTNKQFAILYQRLSPQTQEQIQNIPWDLCLGSFSLFVFLFVLGSRKRIASWIDVFLTLFCAMVAGSLLYFSFFQLNYSQYLEWGTQLEKQGRNPDKETFVSLLPMDMDPGMTEESVLRFFELCGTRGRFFYGLYLFFDLLLLISTTILYRQVFSITYQVIQNSLLHFLVQKLPLAIATLDLYENSCLAVCLFHYSKMVLHGQPRWEISPTFVHRIALATSGKFLLIYFVLGLQVSGLAQYFSIKPKAVEYTHHAKKRK
jgi:hypothetical protein